MAIDPIQGLIDYVTEVKPFHTKILEVAVAYSHNDDVDITITEDLQLDLAIFWPAVAGSPESEGPIRICSAGYGVEYDRATPYIIVDANISPQTISLEGNHENAFDVGSRIEIREPYTAASFGSPITESTPRVAIARVVSVSYDIDTDTTVLGIIILSEGWLGSPITWYGSPSTRPTSTSTFFPVMTDQAKYQNHSFSNLQELIIDGEEYSTRTVSIGGFGSPITADYVMVPRPTDSFDNTFMFVLPQKTNSSGSPAIADTGQYNGKYYIEFEILDLEAPSNTGWGPYFGIGRAERTRADDRYTARPNETVVYDSYGGLDIQHGSGLTDPGGGSNRSIGHVFSMAIDYTNSKWWIAQNGTWLGSGTQDPATNQGGYWPGDFTTTNISGADVNAHMTPLIWLFNQGTGSTGSPFNKPSEQDKIGLRISSRYWSYTPPTDFEEWPNLESHPNVYEPGEQVWHWRDNERAGVTPGDNSGIKTHMSNFGNAAISAHTLASQAGTNYNIYYGLKRSVASGGKFYMEYVPYAAAAGVFGLFDADLLGSPIGVGSPYTRSSGYEAYVTPGDGLVYNSVGLPSATNDPTTRYRDGGIFTSGNPSRDGRSSISGSSGDTFMLAFDFDQNRFWAGVNGTWSWGFDPTTVGSPQGGFKLWNNGGSPDQNALGKTFMASARGVNAGVLNLGGTQFNYDPPTGFEAWAYKAPVNIGSPLTIPSGSPPFGGGEFWFPPYDGNQSGGDVFAIYDVVSTNTLNIVTRPVDAFGSPAIIVGTSSPFTPTWPYPGGSPFPGSPRGFTGSPATYPNFGSPTIYGNTIVVKSTTPEVFLYGQEIEIRNATNADINRAYNIFSARDLGGSPNLVELTVLDRILADTTNDGELLFTPDGFSGGDICGDVPPELLQIHWLEDLDLSWRFGDGSPNQLLQPAFQHFILSANSTSNTVTVQGDVRYILTEFTGSPVSVGSPNISASIQHARSVYGSPFWIGSPYVDLNANNGPVTIQNVVYDASLNESTLTLNSVAVSDPTGWIVSTITPPIPPLEFTALAIADVTFSLSSPLVETPQFIWGSSSDLSTWTPTVSFEPLPGKSRTGGALATDGRSLGNIYDIGYDGNGRWVAVGDPSVGGAWGSPSIGAGAAPQNADGTVLTSDDNGVTWIRRTPGAANTGSPRPLEPFYGVAYNGTIWVAVSFNSDSVASPTQSEIWTSTDNAETWSRGFSGTIQNLNDIEWTGDEFVIVGDNHTLLTSPDGLNWTTVQPGSPLPFENSLTDYTSFEINGSGSPTRWFIGTGTSGSPIFSGNVWYSDDRGVTWNRGVGVGSPGSETGFSGTVYDIAVNPNNDTIVGVGFTDEVFVSNDNGLTWRTVQLDGAGSPFRDPSIYCAEYDPLYGFLIGGTEAWYFKPLLMSGGQDGLSWEARIGAGTPDFNEVWGSPFRASATIQAIGVK